MSDDEQAFDVFAYGQAQKLEAREQLARALCQPGKPASGPSVRPDESDVRPGGSDLNALVDAVAARVLEKLEAKAEPDVFTGAALHGAARKAALEAVLSGRVE